MEQQYNILSLDPIRDLLSLSNLRELKKKFFSDYIENVGDVKYIDQKNGIITTLDDEVYHLETNVSSIFNSLFQEFKDDVKLFSIKYYETNRIDGYKDYLIRNIKLILNSDGLFQEYPYVIEYIKSIIDFLNLECEFDININDLCNSIPAVVESETTVPKEVSKSNKKLITLTPKKVDEKFGKNLNRLYVLLVKEDIIESSIKKHNFVKVLKGEDIVDNEFIEFKVSNRLAKNILQLLMPLYKNISAGTIERTKKFKTRRGVIFTQTNFNKTSINLNQSDLIIFDSIKKRIIKYFPEITSNKS